MVLLILIFLFLRFCSHLPLPTANAATFPDKRGQLTFRILFCLVKKSLYTVGKRNSLVPSFLSGGQNRNDDRRKEYNLTLSKESGSGYRKIHLISPTSAWILTAPVGRVWRLTHFYSVALLLEKWFACHHSIPYFFILVFPTAFYDRSRMTGKYLLSFCEKLFLRVCSHLFSFFRFCSHL